MHLSQVFRIQVTFSRTGVFVRHTRAFVRTTGVIFESNRLADGNPDVRNIESKVGTMPEIAGSSQGDWDNRRVHIDCHREQSVLELAHRAGLRDGSLGKDRQRNVVGQVVAAELQHHRSGSLAHFLVSRAAYFRGKMDRYVSSQTRAPSEKRDLLQRDLVDGLAIVADKSSADEQWVSIAQMVGYENCIVQIPRKGSDHFDLAKGRDRHDRDHAMAKYPTQ
eukprot:292477_1